MEYLLGQLGCFGFNFAPRSWMSCSGQLLPIAQNSALFSLLGTMYGGDGRTTFALPDLRGRAPIGMGHAPGLMDYPIGQRSGVESITIGQINLPPHSHTLTQVAVNTTTSTTVALRTVDNSEVINETGSGANQLGSGGTMGDIFRENPNTGTADNLGGLSATSTSTSDINGHTDNTGAGQPIYQRSPYIAMNWCICTQGLFPSRS